MMVDVFIWVKHAYVYECESTPIHACVLSDRTVGDVLSSRTNFWHPTILPFEK